MAPKTAASPKKKGAKQEVRAKVKNAAIKNPSPLKQTKQRRPPRTTTKSW